MLGIKKIIGFDNLHIDYIQCYNKKKPDSYRLMQISFLGTICDFKISVKTGIVRCIVMK